MGCRGGGEGSGHYTPNCEYIIFFQASKTPHFVNAIETHDLKQPLPPSPWHHHSHRWPQQEILLQLQ